MSRERRKGRWEGEACGEVSGTISRRALGALSNTCNYTKLTGSQNSPEHQVGLDCLKKFTRV